MPPVESSRGQDVRGGNLRCMPTEQKVRTPEETVRSYFDAVIARDPDAMAEHWAEEGIEEILPVGIFRGPQEVKEWFTELFTAVPDFDMTIDRILAHENNVLVQW